MIITHNGISCDVDKEIIDKLKNYFSVASEIGGLHEFLDFFDKNDIPDFFESLSKKYNSNKMIFSNLARIINKLQRKDYAFLLLMSYVSRNIDVGKTIEVDDSMHYDKIKKLFDDACFFARKDSYDKYIRNCKAFGFPDGNTSFQFVTSLSCAEKLIQEMKKLAKKDWSAMKKTYIDRLGYDSSYLDGINVIYRIDLNGKKIKEDAGATNSMSVQLPNGVEEGANDFWLPGGYTSGGMPEIIFNAVPNTSTYVNQVMKYTLNEYSGKRKGKGEIKEEKCSNHKFFN